MAGALIIESSLFSCVNKLLASFQHKYAYDYLAVKRLQFAGVL